MEEGIGGKISQLKAAIGEAAKRANRSPESIEWLLATKGIPPEKIEEAFRAGARDFGENRMQELIEKKKRLPSAIRWHFIGHLQTNKVKFLLTDALQENGKPPLLHSLDREELAEALEAEARKRNISSVPCLIQVNSSEEKTKGGFHPREVESFVKKMKPDSRLRIQGLMTIGPFTEDKELIRKSFRRVKTLQTELQTKFPEKDWGILSMGMSSDFPIAIEEGATLLRIGTAVFGPR